ncbi:serine hydrolase [Sporanaerobacter sp. PP17-6a]|jgi:beta-lactamase class A|uniref:serine hydrolase n=1 Tax=Sporanaerobacter sp. PP17-6a TaxID=1891289 RepID=UPI0008A0107F|nr:serine hydrolase [Sporanaerobacter sp. PP17-6a]SCL81971.1 Extended-spectrum beta-lactamase PER-1 precursor [Sporanaerobacter sp. PP17-6a]
MLENKIREFIKNQKGNVAVAIKDLKTGKEIKINENLVFPSASTIKLSIMSELFNRVNAGSLNLNDKVELTENMKTGGDGILKELELGHKFTLKEIMTLMIIISDNMATNILIDLLGMDNINKRIKDMGLKNTRLQRKMMDSQAAKEGRENLTTANDLCLILELIYRGENINEECSRMMLDILKRQQVRGRLDLYLPEDVIIAHKTGDLDCLEHDVGIVYLPHREYIICVLTNETETNKDGREIIGKVSKMVYDEF